MSAQVEFTHPEARPNAEPQLPTSFPVLSCHSSVFAFNVSCLPSFEISMDSLRLAFLNANKIMGLQQASEIEIFLSTVKVCMFIYLLRKGKGPFRVLDKGHVDSMTPHLRYHPSTGRDTNNGSSDPWLVCFWHAPEMGKCWWTALQAPLG